MKRFIILSFFACLFLPVFCQDISLEVGDFRKDGDKLVLNYRVRISPNSIGPEQGLRLRPVLQAGDSVLFLPETTILGSNKQKVLSRSGQGTAGRFIPSSLKNDTLLAYHINIPYAAWMDSSRLVLEQQYRGYRGKNTLVSYVLKDKVHPDIASKVSNLRLSPSVAFIMPHKQEKRRTFEGTVYLDFPGWRSMTASGYRNNSGDLLKADDNFRCLSSNPDITLHGVCIKGYASPDGSYAMNEHLSGKRADIFKKYLQNKFGLDDKLFTVTSIAEDWDGLAEFVRASDMPQKDKIQEIISTTGIHQGREATLMLVDKGEPYRRMLTEIFPRLRRVEYRINYSFKDYDMQEASALLERHPGNLSHYELYKLALNYGKGSEPFNELVGQTIPLYYTEDATANNNAAALMIQDRNPVAARRYLEKAGDSAAAVNNMGAVFLLEGNTARAEEYFSKAQALGSPEATGNLEKIKEK